MSAELVRAESQTPDVYRAICQVAKEMSRDGIAKDKQNSQQGYRFRGIDDIYNALSAVLAGAGLCILPRMTERTQEERTTQKGGVLFYVTVRAEFDLVSAKDGSRHTVSTYGEAMDAGDKATNKAMSAAYKYACMQVFCIPTEGMEDADAHTPEPAPKAGTKPTAAPAPKSKYTPAQEQVIDQKTADLKPWLANFRKMHDKIGKPSYDRIMGSNGFTSAKEILDSKTAQKVLQEMDQEYADMTNSRGVA